MLIEQRDASLLVPTIRQLKQMRFGSADIEVKSNWLRIARERTGRVAVRDRTKSPYLLEFQVSISFTGIDQVELPSPGTVTIEIRQDHECVSPGEELVGSLGHAGIVPVMVVIHHDDSVRQDVLAAQLEIGVRLFCRVSTVHMNEPKLFVGGEVHLVAHALVNDDAIMPQCGVQSFDIEQQRLG
jgi:hypothetical protein